MAKVYLGELRSFYRDLRRGRYPGNLQRWGLTACKTLLQKKSCNRLGNLRPGKIQRQATAAPYAKFELAALVNG